MGENVWFMQLTFYSETPYNSYLATTGGDDGSRYNKRKN
jgi:hypothetical protein